MNKDHVILAAMALIKGVDIHHPNVNDLKDIQRQALEFGEEITPEEVRDVFEDVSNSVKEGTKRRLES